MTNPPSRHSGESPSSRHSGENRNPATFPGADTSDVQLRDSGSGGGKYQSHWMPACAGMTTKPAGLHRDGDKPDGCVIPAKARPRVIPAKAGIQRRSRLPILPTSDSGILVLEAGNTKATGCRLAPA